MHLSKEAILSELRQLLDKSVWEYLDKAKLSKKQLKAVIRSSMFLKEKHDARGIFTKMKARLVAGGDRQNKGLYTTIYRHRLSVSSLYS